MRSISSALSVISMDATSSCIWSSDFAVSSSHWRHSAASETIGEAPAADLKRRFQADTRSRARSTAVALLVVFRDCTKRAFPITGWSFLGTSTTAYHCCLLRSMKSPTVRASLMKFPTRLPHTLGGWKA